jgi:hypothetical protein
VPATDSIAGIAAMLHVLARPLKDAQLVMNLSQAAIILATRSSVFHTGHASEA